MRTRNETSRYSSAASIHLRGPRTGAATVEAAVDRSNNAELKSAAHADEHGPAGTAIAGPTSSGYSGSSDRQVGDPTVGHEIAAPVGPPDEVADMSLSDTETIIALSERGTESMGTVVKVT